MISMRFTQQFKTDLRRLLREPVLILFCFVPLFALAAIKILLIIGEPLLIQEMGFDLSPWYGYILSGVMLIAPAMLGAVSGFIMIDDRDESITDLMSITPLGFSGYMINRSLLPFIASILYTFIGYYILSIYYIKLSLLILISILAGIQGITAGLFLFILTDNKVKGLTYAKGLSGLIITAFADLANIPWLSILSGFLPFYWTARLITAPFSLTTAVLSFVVHGFWLGAALYKATK